MSLISKGIYLSIYCLLLQGSTWTAKHSSLLLICRFPINAFITGEVARTGKKINLK